MSVSPGGGFHEGRHPCTRQGHEELQAPRTTRGSRANMSAAFPINTVTTCSKGRQGKYRAVTCVFASSPHHPPLRRTLLEYRLRFGNESSYSELSDIYIRTSTRGPKPRLLYVATGLSLVSIWVEKKSTNLPKTRRGPRGGTVHEGLLPYERLLPCSSTSLSRTTSSYWP